jgi:hypothetical protein
MISISSRGIPEVVAWLQNVARGSKITAMRAIAEYLIGDDNHGLKPQPARVEHGEDNPYVWQSDKQRRAYFASNGFGGGIPSTRTETLKNAWAATESDNNWTSVKIVNSAPYARFVQGRDLQRGHIVDKWRDMWTIIGTNIQGAFRHANAKLREYLQTQKKG